MNFFNNYEDTIRAEAYSKLEFPGSYYLAYRDLPDIINKYVKGTNALDFGCGTGRSTRFLKKLGFDVTGIDISKDMVKKALELDSTGNYILIWDGDFSRFEKNYYDLIISLFTFDNIPGKERRIGLLRGLSDLLNREGIIILLDSTPELYVNEWESFSTKDFPENKSAGSGDMVKIITTVIEDKRPVEDVIWFNEDYLEMFEKSGLKLVETIKPLGNSNEPYEWINEMEIAPWIIYIVKK